MTTFIDFRYSQTLAAAMFAGRDSEEAEIALAPAVDNFLAFEVRGAPSERPLARFDAADGVPAANLFLDAGDVISLRRANGDVLVRSDALGDGKGMGRVVALRLGPGGVGVRGHGAAREVSGAPFAAAAAPLVLAGEDADRVRVMGRGSGRAMRWAELFYRRSRASGLRVELAMDWHHLRAGIPWFGTMTAERLIEQGRFALAFRSYAYDEREARATDFARLFGSEGAADIAVHLTPPLYANPAPDRPNLGFFVVESPYVSADLVARCNLMDAICVPSRFAGEACRRAGVRRPIHVVPHGVDVDYFRPAAGKVPLPGGRGFNFLAVCTHVERKNARHLVRAFLEEFREREDVALFLLLRPEYHTSQNNVALDFTEWERRHDRGSAPVLLWTDYVSRARLRDLYANASAYVMPSNEGFGLTLLEAMACGTPVIGLDYGGVVDFVNRDNGTLVPAGREYVARDIDTLPYVGDRFRAPDVGRLRAAMRHVFEHEGEARRRAEVARRDCEARYGWDQVSREFARVIEETHRLASRSPRPAVAAPAPAAWSWVLCVIDDDACDRSLRDLKARATRARVLCLFTRYARLRDVVRARRLGFIAYRWDGTVENARRTAGSLLGPGWIGVLFPDERVSGDEEAMASFLAGQPASVGEVDVDCGAGRRESRFLRIGPGDIGVARVSCPLVSIASRNGPNDGGRS